ncbi:hypothetical protein Tco_0959576 [Tanacetum coccineum]
MANEVLDDGLANNPMDPGLLELKEMMDQMFTVYGAPNGYAKLADSVWEEWHKMDENIPTRLNFYDAEDIDLNVTQPPATQEKVVGDADDEKTLEEHVSLLESLENYVS